jgi:hypothetical protein
MEIRSVILALLALTLTTFGGTEAIRINTSTKRIVDMTSVKIPSGMTLEVESGGIVKFSDLNFIADANANEILVFDTVTSAVNEITVANAATGNGPTISATGGDTNVSLNLTPKGSGVVNINGLGGINVVGPSVIGGNVRAGVTFGTGSGVGFGDVAWIVNSGTDKLKFWNSTFNGAPLIQLGGETTSFPAIKRSSTSVGIRLADDSADAPFSASNGTFSGTMTVGGGSTVQSFRTGTTTWDPGSLANGATEKKSSVTVTGVAVGDPVTASLTTIVSSDWAVQACVTATNTVEVKITNNTGGVVDLGSGTLRINCIKF